MVHAAAGRQLAGSSAGLCELSPHLPVTCGCPSRWPVSCQTPAQQSRHEQPTAELWSRL